jgi:hypothetical protein
MAFKILGLLCVMACETVLAQTPASLRQSDYVGTYEDRPGHTLEIVAGDGLFAVQDEAKYRLQPAGIDAFTVSGGLKVPFRRDAQGKITGYEQDVKFHKRLSQSVSASARALAYPRLPGQNSPSDYRYRAPQDLHDGIAVSDISQTPLGKQTAEAIVRAILDGTYKDVHSVLLYQRGHLVMEEYFYGYSVSRQHQLRSATKSVVSALAGIAVDRRALTGADEPVLPHMNHTSYANPDP